MKNPRAICERLALWVHRNSRAGFPSLISPSTRARACRRWRNRGTADVCIVVCDGLQGLSEAINTVWSRAVVQICVIHLLRNTFRYASRKYWDQIAKDIRPVCTAATEAAAEERFTELTAKEGAQYPAITQLWENAWSGFVRSRTTTSRSAASSAPQTRWNH
ncbi:transposase-like protein [Mycobacterium sp. URHB0021]